MKAKRLTLEDAREMVARVREQSICSITGGPVFQFDQKERDARLSSGRYRRATPAEILGDINFLAGDFRDPLKTVKALRGGLLALQELADLARSQTRDEIQEALAPHFRAIAGILNEARAAYMANVAAIEKATKEAALEEAV